MRKHGDKVPCRGLLKIPGLGRTTGERDKKHRRRFLGASAATLATGAAIPKTWVKPVVDSVLLPAHAQTSGCQSTKLTVPGAKVSCSDGELEDFQSYRVFLNDESCLEVMAISGGIPSGSGDAEFAWDVDNTDGYLGAIVSATNADGSQTNPYSHLFVQHCGDSCNDEGPTDYVLQFDDAPFQVAFSLTRTCGGDPTLVISEIEVSLVG